MNGELNVQLVAFLWNNTNVFAWSHEDMPGIDPSIMVHKLNADPNYRPVKHKRKSYAPKRNQAAVEEVDKLLHVGFI